MWDSTAPKPVVKKESASAPKKSRTDTLVKDYKYILHQWILKNGFAGFNKYAQQCIKDTDFDSVKCKELIRKLLL